MARAFPVIAVLASFPGRSMCLWYQVTVRYLKSLPLERLREAEVSFRRLTELRSARWHSRYESAELYRHRRRFWRQYFRARHVHYMLTLVIAETEMGTELSISEFPVQLELFLKRQFQ